MPGGENVADKSNWSPGLRAGVSVCDSLQMSQLGHSRHFERAPATSGLPSTADISHKAGIRCVVPTSGPRGNNPPGPLVSTIDSRWSLYPPRREELRPRALFRYWSGHLRSGRAGRYELALEEGE
jgi:hypothetical protein